MKSSAAAVAKRVLSVEEIKALNDKYHGMSIRQRIGSLYQDFAPEEIMLTSSFAATSAFLLREFSKVNKEQVIFFIDTGYHFEETLAYKQDLIDRYGLNVKSISALKEEHEFTTKDEPVFDKR